VRRSIPIEDVVEAARDLAADAFTDLQLTPLCGSFEFINGGQKNATDCTGQRGPEGRIV
jgi:hypothetical protein